MTGPRTLSSNFTSRRQFLKATGAVCSAGLVARSSSAAEEEAKPERQIFTSDREDGRFTSSVGLIHAYLKHLKPKLAFDPKMKAEDFPAWREAVRTKLSELICFPEFDETQPPCKKLWSKQREGYRLEKWEAFPEPYSVVPFLLLVPDGVSQQSPAPGVACFPGSFSSKESMTEEVELSGEPCSHRHAARNRMAWEYARAGIVAAAVENPATNEVADSIRKGSYEFSVHSMWAGRSYEGISTFQKHHILQWLKQEPYVDAARVATSGHSLGAKPALMLGVLDPEVKAVVWNDGITNWRERAVATNLERIGTFQYVPGLLEWFDYPDLQASLAPRPFLVTEGGRTSVLEQIGRAYELTGAADQYKFVYYPKYASPESRLHEYEDLPEGLSMQEYFPYSNCDPGMHHFKGKVAVPWLANALGTS